MRIVCMGTGGFVVPTFHALRESRHSLVAVVTRPEKPGVGKKRPPPSPMRLAVESTDLPVLTPPSVNEPGPQQQLRELDADLLLVCDFGQILSAETLGVTRLGGVNLHGSLLPAYRGAAPVQWAVYDGCQETGVTTIHMTPRLDAGPILTQRRVAIGPEETAAELEARLAVVGVEAVLEAFAMLERWDGTGVLGTPQDPARATRAPRLKKSDGLVDWNRTAKQIADQVRAFQPWPLTFTFWCPPDKPAMRLVLDRVSVASHAGPPAGAVPGTVLSTAPDWLMATGQGVLRIDQVQPAGKRPMPAADFLRGHAVAAGDVLESISD